MGLEFESRANANFLASRTTTKDETRKMLTANGAKGLSGNSGNVRQAVEIFHAQSSLALKQSLDEMANRIEHRGRAWRIGATAIGTALESHIESAPPLLIDLLRDTRVTTNPADAQRAVEHYVNEVGKQLRRELVDFQDGWSAPRAKRWKERHPYLDRIAFLLIGAAITLAGAAIERKYFTPAADGAASNAAGAR